MLESLILAHTDLLVRTAAEVAQRYGFSGSWRFGLVVTQLRGAVSYVLAVAADVPQGACLHARYIQAGNHGLVARLIKEAERVVREFYFVTAAEPKYYHEMWPWLREPE